VLLQAVLDYDRMLAERGGAAKGTLVDPFVFAAVLVAAACHAGWNASIKRTLDPLATTTLIAIGAGLVALPAIPFLGWPSLRPGRG
jgi:hypothetical protein